MGKLVHHDGPPWGHSGSPSSSSSPTWPERGSSRAIHLAQLVLGLAPTDLRLFLLELNENLTLQSKQASTAIMWSTLTPRERLLFEMPGSAAVVAASSSSSARPRTAPTAAAAAGLDVLVGASGATTAVWPQPQSAWTGEEILRGPGTLAAARQQARALPVGSARASASVAPPPRASASRSPVLVTSRGTSTAVGSGEALSAVAAGGRGGEVPLPAWEATGSSSTGRAGPALSFAEWANHVDLRPAAAAPTEAAVASDIGGFVVTATNRRRQLEGQIFEALMEAIDRVERVASRDVASGRAAAPPSPPDAGSDEGGDEGPADGELGRGRR
ncbi:hypothetical protein HK405_013251, partial [Cladochytrium tenue]